MITDATATYAGNGLVSFHFDAHGVMITLNGPAAVAQSLAWQILTAVRDAAGDLMQQGEAEEGSGG